MYVRTDLVVIVLRDPRFVQDAPAFVQQWNEFIDTLDWSWSEQELVKRVLQYMLQVTEPFKKK